MIYNIDHEIQFKRNTKGFEYEFNGEKHKYYPDFILEDGTYVEVKGYYTEQAKVKMLAFPYQLEVLDKHKMKAYLDYVVEKYGKDYINLYEKEFTKGDNKL